MRHRWGASSSPSIWTAANAELGIAIVVRVVVDRRAADFVHVLQLEAEDVLVGARGHVQLLDDVDVVVILINLMGAGSSSQSQTPNFSSSQQSSGGGAVLRSHRHGVSASSDRSLMTEKFGCVAAQLGTSPALRACRRVQPAPHNRAARGGAATRNSTVAATVLRFGKPAKKVAAGLVAKICLRRTAPVRSKSWGCPAWRFYRLSRPKASMILAPSLSWLQSGRVT